MYTRIRPLIFRADPERAHMLTLRLLQAAGAVQPVAKALRARYAVEEAQGVELFGLRFANRVGLAAGYDKDGLAWRGLAVLGFGHIEIGTVTPRPQRGNPKPRIFRLVEDQALINRLGFPSRGSEFVARRLQGPRPEGLRIGVNLGINRDTPLDRAAEDYAGLLRVFAPLADYLVINVSSPNTPGLRNLEAAEQLAALLDALEPERSVPLLVKLSPDLDAAGLEATLDALLEAGIDGVIATNTTLQHPPLASPQSAEAGGLSGAPLSGPARAVVARIAAYTQGRLPIVAAGGILGPAEAQAALDAGASLVQVYTGLVYRGPDLVRQITAAVK
jgi:dihydroorotate dehydrogenase